MHHTEIDKIDSKILYQLDLNARQSHASIGKTMRLHRNVVSYRIKRLEERRILLGYYTEIDTTRFGYFAFRTFLRFWNATPKKQKDIIDALLQDKCVGWIARVQGSMDLDFIYWCKTPFDFDVYQRSLLLSHGNSIETISHSLLLRIHHYHKAYLVGMQYDTTTPTLWGGPLEHIDETDLAILTLLASHASLPVIDIAKVSKLTSQTIIHRIKILEKKKIILGYRALMDTELLGYKYFKVHLTLMNRTSAEMKRLSSFIQFHPNIPYRDDYIGGDEIEIEVHLKSDVEFREFVDTLRREFPFLIRKVEWMLFYWNAKFNYLPDIA